MFQNSGTDNHKTKHHCLSYLWKGRTTKNPWDVVCKLKEKGLGLRKIEQMKIAIGVKLIWKVVNKEGLWAKWMHETYIRNKSFREMERMIEYAATWKDLLKLKTQAMKFIRKRIMDGITTILWNDP